MSLIRVVAIPTKLAEAVRREKTDPQFGFPVYSAPAGEGLPCRHCLDWIVEGVERATLFTLDPFAGVEKFPLPGPVYIHRRDARAWCSPRETYDQPSDTPGLCLPTAARGTRVRGVRKRPRPRSNGGSVARMWIMCSCAVPPRGAIRFDRSECRTQSELVRGIRSRLSAAEVKPRRRLAQVVAQWCAVP